MVTAHLSNDKKMQVLIDTWWNVNIIGHMELMQDQQF